MFTSAPFDVERFRYWQGQALRSRDFRAQLAVEAELGWWHNRALHLAYGVRSGFAVTPIAGADSLQGVKIGCGVAYDCYGRTLVLQIARELPLPPILSTAPKEVILIVRYKETSTFQRNEVALSGSSRIEEPEFTWVFSGDFDPVLGVPLTRLNYQSKTNLQTLPLGVKFEGPLAQVIQYDAMVKELIFTGMMREDERKQLKDLSTDKSYRDSLDSLFELSQHVPKLEEQFPFPVSRPLARPRIGSGDTVPGDTPWEVWEENTIFLRGQVARLSIGMQVTIDTSAAGFTETPCYFAWLGGVLWNKTNTEFFPVPITHVDREKANQFRFRVWLPPIGLVLGARTRIANYKFATEFINHAREQGLHVCWAAIQPAALQGEICAEFETPECQTTP